MPDLNTVDRLQPCLLDRLFDDEPRKTSEAKHEKVVSITRFKEGIKRDIEWLLNSRSRFDDLDGSRFGEIRDCVLNFGIRDLTGLTSENLSAGEVERLIHRAISTFEPRIIKGSLRVQHLAIEEGSDGEDLRRIHALDFEISGKLWVEPLPQDFTLRTELSLEDGAVSIY
jgi:type VI secretion system protein ImpF